MIQSTISDSAHAVRNSEELVDSIGNIASNPRVATHTSDGNYATDTTNRNYPQKLLANCEIPSIIQGVIPPVNQVTVDGVSTCGGALHAVHTVLLEEIVTGVASSAAHVFKDPLVVNWNAAIRLIPIDMNIVGVSQRANIQFMTGTGTPAPTICIRRQKIGSLRGSIGPQKARNTHLFKNSINKISPEHEHHTPIFSKLIDHKIVPDESADVYAHKSMEFGSNSVAAESPNFMNFGLSPANTPDKLKFITVPTIKVGRLMNVSNWIQPRHNIEEVKAERMSKAKAYNDYI